MASGKILIADIHAKTMLKMEQQLERGNMETIKSYFRNSKRLDPKPLENCDSFQDLANLLWSKELIRHGEYDLLKKVFKSIGMNVLIDDLTKAEKEIARIKPGGED